MSFGINDKMLKHRCYESFAHLFDTIVDLLKKHPRYVQQRAVRAFVDDLIACGLVEADAYQIWKEIPLSKKYKRNNYELSLDSKLLFEFDIERVEGDFCGRT